MRRHSPDSDELDDEIRGHMALGVKERIERGESPEAARLAALKEFGNVTLTRESIRSVWRPRWLEAAAALGRDIRFAMRSLLRVKGLATTVVVTLALGIGANAAIFSVVRSVLLRPLVNRDEDRLVYIRQGAPGIGAENTTFSVPEIDDIKARVTTISAFGDFSTVAAAAIASVQGFAYSRDAELEADAYARRFIAAAGLPPTLPAAVWRKFSDEEQRRGAQGLPAWLSTHPSTEERLGAGQRP